MNNGARNTKTTYTYNEDGIRIMKDFEGIKSRYLLDGTNIIAQEVTNGDSLDYIYFFYDASGSPVGMNYLGNNYFYKKNLQGDIIEIWGTEDGTDNHAFRRLVEYVYDAWGNILQMNDTTDGWFKVGTANPFRYRGYYTTLAMHGCGMELERRKEVYCEKIDSFMERTRLSFSI